jgi:hypothetical protein
MICIWIVVYVAVDVDQLDKEVSAVVGCAWSDNTLLTRNSQWKRFLQFCASIKECPLPASSQTVSRFLVHLSKSAKFSTINNYLSAINMLHRFYGYPGDYRDIFLVKLVLDGLRNILGVDQHQMMPLRPDQLYRMYTLMEHTIEHETLWTALMLSFRTLLRKSNVVPDSVSRGTHTLRRKDITFTDSGCNIIIHSTKTLRHQDRLLKIPLLLLDNPVFCVVSRLKCHFQMFPGTPDSYLFYRHSSKGIVPVIYSDLLKFIKSLVCLIGLNPQDVGTHSMRRSGAAFLHSIGVPLVDIKSLGDWKSYAVLLYLLTPFDRMIQLESQASHALNDIKL